MTSNQDNKQKELAIVRTGIEVMNELSLDADKMLYLAQEGALLPYFPEVHPSWFKMYISSRYNQKDRLSKWMYRQSDVEEFKIKHKDFWEDARQQKAIAPAESQKQSKEDQLFNQSTDKETTLEDVKEYIDKCLANRVPKEKIAVELKKKYKLSFLEIGRSLDNEGLNSKQHAALKQRGQRIYKKGLEIIDKEKKGRKATKG